MGSHECSCAPGRCTEELCKSVDGIWSTQCPDHCTECGNDDSAGAPAPVEVIPQETDGSTEAKAPADETTSTEAEASAAPASVEWRVSTIVICIGTLIALL